MTTEALFGLTSVLAVVLLCCIWALILFRSKAVQLQQQLGVQQTTNQLQAQQSQHDQQLLQQTQLQLQQAQDDFKDLSYQQQKYAAELARSQSQYQQVSQLWTELKQQHQAQQQDYMQLQRDHSALQISLKEKQQHFVEQQALLQNSKQQLSLEFQQLAQQIFEDKSVRFQASNQEALNSLLNPFRLQLDAFKSKVEDIHLKDSQQQALLNHELQHLKILNQQITEEAHQLAVALKGQKKTQGNWGELVLENVLERSGLRAGQDYQREFSVTQEDGAKLRPDLVVFLPQGKHLIIDAKVSLNAYSRYINSEDDLERQLALQEHVAAMAARIKELSDRNYHKLPGLNSPDLVFMFVPIESAFVEALKADESLFQQALNQNVLVATPTTLLTSLNIVRQLWRYEDQHKHTAELAKRADAVFNKLRTFLTTFLRVKESLNRAQEAYETAESQLYKGRANLVKQVNEFKDLTPAIQAELPEYFVEKSQIEFDAEAQAETKTPSVS
ncbi:DNA recombination protein RmuC [Rheinheimera soli]|uniref:DNA recombination protein RmuC n=1 Tax=Rheinheimera soli TaxID=443616 RepID=A0ABU1VW69_9GAMM|nr:DNA recombination protein RmuC [Rheinheimera soli]MDR7119830.1 DNA recombination protein RmuC [Rheinheimera soli]